jgi:asparagine synthase (glutamine-hydrolysing)
MAAAAAQVPASSVANGVAIASWDAASGVFGPQFHGDYAVAGSMRELCVAGATQDLRGDFACVRRDGRALVLARSRFGGRPLFYARVDDAVVACSSLLPLASLLRGRLTLNLDHLAALFSGAIWAAKHPLPFENVHGTRANAVVRLELSSRPRTCVGALPGEPAMAERLPALVARVRAEFREAVQRSCGMAKRVGVLVSGGVDSSFLLACAVLNERERGGPAVVPITMDYGGIGDDRPYFQALSDSLGVDAVRVRVSEGTSYAGQERVVDASAHSAAPASIMFAVADRAREAGVEVLLSGGSSEDLFCEDVGAFHDFFVHDPFAAIVCLARFRGIYESRWQSVRRLAVVPLARALLPGRLLELRRRAGERAELGFPWAGPRLRALIRSRRPPAYSPAVGPRARLAELAGSELLVANKDHAARWEIATGMPTVHPYLDDDFVCLLGRIPSAALFAGNRERGLLRESMADIVPDRVRYRMDKSRPFEGFREAFTDMGGLDAVRELLSMRELGDLSLVDPEGFRRDFEAFAAAPENDVDGWWRLWGAIAAEAFVRWFREFNAGSATTVPARAPWYDEAVP